MVRPTKTEKWTPESIPKAIPIKKGQDVYTCTIDSLRRPSAIADAVEGQKCIVILLENKEN